MYNVTSNQIFDFTGSLTEFKNLLVSAGPFTQFHRIFLISADFIIAIQSMKLYFCLFV